MIDRPLADPGDIWHDAMVGPGQGAPHPSRRPRRAAARRSRRRWWLAMLGYGALALACLSTATVAFLFVAAPVELVRDQIVEQVRARTGRDLVVAGPSSLSFFPRLGVSLSDVSLSSAQGREAAPVLLVSKVDAELSLWSFFAFRPAVERVTLHRPMIDLIVNDGGHRSWDLARARDEPRRHPSATDGSAGRHPPAAVSRNTQALASPGPWTMRIIDGTVRHRSQDGIVSEIRSLNLTLAAEGPAKPLRADGTLSFRGTPLTIAGTISLLPAFGQPANLALRMSGAPFTASYEGELALADGVSVDGAFKLEAPSARALGDWLGRPLPSAGDSDRVTASGRLRTSKGQVLLSDLHTTLGGGTLSGSLSLDTSQKRLRLNGSLELSELDFGRLLLKPGRGPPAKSSDPIPPAVAPPGRPPAARYATSRGWSDDPINLAVLGVLDANLALTARRIVYKELKTGPGRLHLALEGGVAKIMLEDLELYRGRAQGVLTLDGTGEVLVAGADLKLDRVDLQPLLTDALDFPWLEGYGSISLVLTGQGLSERQIVESLNGKVEMASSAGAIAGADVGKIVRSLQRARLPPAPSFHEKTPFTELAGIFVVTNGVAQNDDLRLIGPHVELKGTGKLELGPRQIDYTVRTKVGGTPEPGAALKFGRLEVPVSIVGPWERPSFAIKGQEKLTGALKQIRKNLRSQDVRDAIKGLLEGDGESRAKARDLVEKLLKKD